MDVLRARTERQPDQTLYTFLAEGETESERLTCAGLDRRARALGGALQRLGLRGENALLLFPAGLEFVAAFFGCLYGGVTAVPAYPPRANREDPRLRALARDARPRVVLTTVAILARLGAPDGGMPELRDALWLATDDPACGDEAAWADPGADGRTLAFLQYTSGSTSDPKGVLVTHGNLLHNQEMIRRSFRQDERSVIVGWLPLYHDMGLIGNVLQPLYADARCVLMSPQAFLQRPLRWLDAISRYRATTSGGPDFAYDLCARRIGEAERRTLDLSSWEVAFNGAEPVRPESLERFAAAFAPCGFRPEAFYPCYGLAEATLFVSGGEWGSRPRVLEVDAAALERHTVTEAIPGTPMRRLVGCGRPWIDGRVVVADPDTLRPCPPGAVGEIWIAGPHVASGYLGRPEATARDFAARLTGSGEGPFLRTGDLGFQQEGDLYVTGRLKDLIILHGRNHYPQDLEATVEAAHPDLRPGGVAAFALEVDGRERLAVVAEVERRREAAASPEAITGAVRYAVAEAHAAQVRILVLIRAGGLPKTSSGKVRRGACRSDLLAGRLPVIARHMLDEAAAETLPEARGEDLPLLEVLRREAAGVLRIAPRDLPDGEPLTRFGLDSVAAAELCAALEEILGTAPDWTALLEGADLRRIAAALAAAPGSRRPSAEISPGSSPPPDEAVPLSGGQLGLWLEHRRDPGSAAYNVAAAARIAGPLDAAALERAFRGLALRHPALRATFAEGEGGPVQRWAAGAGISFERIDATAWAAAELSRWLADEAHRPFDLARGPLLRVHLLGRGPEEAVLLLVLHHIVVDLRSLEILVRDLRLTYGAAVRAPGRPEPEAPARACAAFAIRQRELLAGPRGEELWSFWSAELAGGLPPLELPADRPHPAAPGSGGAAAAASLSRDLSQRIGAAARAAGATPFAFLLAAFQVLLHRVTGAERVAVGVPASGRTLPGTSDLVGYFVQTVVVAARIGRHRPWLEAVRETQRCAAAALAHQDLPFPLVAERLGLAASAPLQALFVHHRPREEALAAFALGKAGARLDLAGLAVESLPLEPRSAKLDLELATAEIDGRLSLQLRHCTDRFDPATARRMVSWLEVLLAAAVEEPERPVSTLPLLSVAERQEIAVWNATDIPFPRELCVHQLIEAQADGAPDAPALASEGSTLTYAALDRRANQLARRLRRLGVGPGDFVGLSVERSAEMVVALLGVLKAGAAYVPLDPNYPRERLALMAEDAGLAAIVAQPGPLAALPDSARRRVVDLEADGALLAVESERRPAVPVPAGSLAYVIYTSGSTGRPKGVMVQHRNVVSLFAALDAWLGSGPGVWLAVTSLSFDISVLELLWTLSRGFLVVIHPEMRWAAAAIPERIAAQRVTHLQCTPSLARLLTDLASEPGARSALGSLRALLLGGETLPADLARVLREVLPEVAIHNLYGPTETTVWSAAERVDAVEEAVPIGRPLANTHIRLLDPSGQPVPAGVAGEICIGGQGVARGYLGRPDFTAERFVPDAWSGEPGARLYRTGDLGRRRPGTPLEFLGRIDHQVKIRGHRIEPGEIEATLAAFPDVRQAVVVAREEGTGDVRLVAYVVAGEAPPALPELRAFLGERLPDALVPSSFVLLESLPLTPNGKIDRRALPAPAPAEPGEEERAAPRTPVEERLAAIWADLLGLGRVGRRESFFALGGHSLLATRLLARVRAVFGVELPIRLLFEKPTVAALAAALEGSRILPRPSPIPRIPRTAGALPLSWGQEQLWFLDQMRPGAPAYHLPAKLRLRGFLSVAALRRSLETMVRRHEALRTRYELRGDSPVQIVEAGASPGLPVVDLTALAPEVRAREAERLALATARRPFDLGRAPLVRGVLLRLADDESVLILVVHHIAADGHSLGLLLRELDLLYGAVVAGRSAELPEPPIQQIDFVLWQRERLRGERLASLLGFWKDRLDRPGEPFELRAGSQLPAVRTWRGTRAPLAVPPPFAEGLRALARERGATPFMLLLAAFAALLHRSTGQEWIDLGVPASSRSEPELEETVGLLLNTLVLRSDLSGRPGFAALVGRVREAAFAAYAHQELPFPLLVEALGATRSLDRNPLFQVFFALHEAPLPAPDLTGIATETIPLDPGSARFDLALDLTARGRTWSGWIEHDLDRFEPATVQRLASRFLALLAAVLDRSDLPIADLPLFAPDERREIVAWTPDGEIGRGRPAAQGSGALLTPTEEVLAALWSDLLGVERIGAEESFFAQGGHSLLAMRAAARVRTAFGVDLPVRVLFESPTVRAVAAFLDEERRSGPGPTVPPLGSTPRPEALPLSFAQQRLWFLHQLEPDSPSYNDLAVLALEGRLDVAALRCAQSEVVRRHEVLRTSYPLLDDRPVQRIEPWAPVPLPVVDLSALEAGPRQSEIRRHVAEEARRPFDLLEASVLRTVLLRLAAEEHALLFSLHHIASDAWSGALLVREITAVYDAVRQGRPSPLPELLLQYADFAVWQQRWFQGAVLEQHLDYWRKALGGSPPALRLPTGRPRPERRGSRGLRRTFRMPQALSRSLGDLSRREGATLFMTLLAAYYVLLQRATGQEDVVVGTAVANRGRAETEALIGLFIEMLPLRVDLSGNPRFVDLLRRVREVSLGAFAHQDFPLERLTEELRRDGDAASLFQVAFGVRNAPLQELRVPELTIRPIRLEQEGARFDVTVWVTETFEGLETTWTFRSDLFEEKEIERINGQYEALLRSVAASPEARIGSFDLGSAEERERRAREEQAWSDAQAGKLVGIRHRRATAVEAVK